MGNAALRDLAHIETVPFDTLKGQTLGIDAHNWLYRYLTITVRFTGSAAYTTTDGKEVANLIGILQGVAKLLEGSVTPLFVFDGQPSSLKADEIEARRQQRKSREADLEAARERGDMVEISRLESQTQQLTETIQFTSRELLDRLDIPHMDAPAAGEAQAAVMAQRGDVDAVGSEDYDAMLFGAPVTIRQLTSSGDIERLELAATLDSLGITYEQLVDAAILMGTDYNDGATGYGPKTSVSAVAEHGDLWGVLEAEGLTIDGADRIRDLYFDPPVNESIPKINFPSPAIDAVRGYVVEEWEIDPSAIERPLERIEEATRQTGLGQFG